MNINQKAPRNSEQINDMLNEFGMGDNEDIQLLNKLKRSVLKSKKAKHRSRSKKKAVGDAKKNPKKKRSDSISVKSNAKRNCETSSAQNRTDEKSVENCAVKSLAREIETEKTNTKSVVEKPPTLLNFPPLDKVFV